MNGENYHQWSRGMRMTLSWKNKRKTHWWPFA